MDVGFIGLGNIGAPMAERLLDAGHDLAVYDVREEAAAPLVDAGARGAADPAGVARRSDVTLLSLPGAPEVREVVSGPDGIASAAGNGHVVANTSTIDPGTATEVAADLSDRGSTYLGAPVSGGRSGAEEGTLSVMAGGDRDAFERCEPVFRAFASDVFHVGDGPEHGHATKLLNNYVMLAARAATAEALVLGEHAGLDMATTLEVINASSGRNSATDRVFPKYVATGTYDKGSTLGLIDEDIHLAMSFAGDEGVPMLLGETVNQLLSYAVSDQGADADSTRLYTFFERMMRPGE